MKAKHKNPKETYMRLLKRGRKSLLRFIFSRAGIMLTMLIIQIALIVFAFISFEQFLPHIYTTTLLLSAIIVIYLLNSSGDPSSKITWLVLVMITPIFGVLLYLFTKSDIGNTVLKKRLAQLNAQTENTLPTNTETVERLRKESAGAAGLADYLYRTGGFSVYENTAVTYLPSGEEMLFHLTEQLQKAKSFIFMEYFIIEEGVFWGSILEILIRKAAAGVDVRILCDGTNELTTLSSDYIRRLKAHGIKCKMFNRVTPFLGAYYNYRDHRKITVIDGHTAFNGGINLADEYINQKCRFGHWKDSAIMLKGEAVQSFTLMFQRMWWLDESCADMDTELQTHLTPTVNTALNESGFVIPYADCPVDRDKVGERVYMDILNRSTRYVRIISPYLILDTEMETALKFAAERGVEVTLILPGIPDKKAPYALAKTHYKSLLRSGVKIYEYTPGFVHAKVFLSDDTEAVVGTINLDYRSFYHHFECATYMYGTDCIKNVLSDFNDTLEKCTEITIEKIKKEKLRTKLLGYLLKSIAPLL